MKVVIIGGTGFVGAALVRHLRAHDHDVVVGSRSPDAACDELGVPTCSLDRDALATACRGADGVVNLAGAGVFDRRWSPAYKRVLRSSRVALTERLVDALASVDADERPPVLVNASAIGYHGDAGETELDESSPAGDDFLAELCVDWEEAASRAEEHGLRVVRARVGVVLGRGGGALKHMLPPFRLGLGGPVGSGRQWVSWIHLDDAVALLVRALEDDGIRGALNLTAPEPVRMRVLAHALGRALGRPAVLPVPGFALRLVKGEVADAMLGSARVLPAKALTSGHEFRFPVLETALRDLV